MADQMTIEILADGTIKTTTDPISAANHQSANAFVLSLDKLTGGPVDVKKRHAHGHQHAHQHAHATEQH